jgi:hypothetical protein
MKNIYYSFFGLFYLVFTVKSNAFSGHLPGNCVRFEKLRRHGNVRRT